jgi:OOP family OmpA-OmpF porin
MKMINILLTFSLLLVAGAAQARDAGVYAGAKLGAYSLDTDEEGLDIDYSDMAWGFYGGFRFNQYFSAEIEYLSLEEDSDKIFGVNVDLEADGWVVSARPTLPLNNNFEVYAKLGWAWLDSKASAFGFSETDSEDDFFWGVGATWYINKLHIRGEIQADDDVPDFLVYTVGVGVEF